MADKAKFKNFLTLTLNKFQLITPSIIVTLDRSHVRRNLKIAKITTTCRVKIDIDI